MADCPPAKIYVGEHISAVVPILIDELKRHGASVRGGADGGSFSISLPMGSVSGSFRVSSKSLDIEIFNRPVVVSCGQLESRLQDYILDAKALLKNRQR